MLNGRIIVLSGGLAAVAGAGAFYAICKNMGSIEDYNASVAETRYVLNDSADTRDLIRYATLAANSHNTQPWKFKVRGRSIDILPDFARRLTAFDPDNHHLYAILGCAAENLAIAAGVSGKRASLSFDRANGGAVSL